ncbi:MAG: hypothetical protein D8M61_18190 [Ignavibacteriae bacterium]|nr:hypothetical protein [Ignavibacteriota bacterium]
MLFGLVCSLLGQDSYKGKISLLLDQKKIEVPIIKVLIRKNDNIQIEVFGVTENGEKGETVMLYFSVDDFNSKKVHTTDLTIKIDYGLSQYHRTIFSLRGNFAQYSSKSKRLDFSDFNTNFSIKEVSYNNNSVRIIGNFSGVYSVKTGSRITSGTAEIKDGQFEIIF